MNERLKKGIAAELEEVAREHVEMGKAVRAYREFK
jgi:hypothetical protein